eukprot:15327440-Ditylum_brightwellii.AAC.1
MQQFLAGSNKLANMPDLIRQIGSFGQIFTGPLSLYVKPTAAPFAMLAKHPRSQSTESEDNENKRKKKEAEKEWLQKKSRDMFRCFSGLQVQ